MCIHTTRFELTLGYLFPPPILEMRFYTASAYAVIYIRVRAQTARRDEENMTGVL